MSGVSDCGRCHTSGIDEDQENLGGFDGTSNNSDTSTNVDQKEGNSDNDDHDVKTDDDDDGGIGGGNDEDEAAIVVHDSINTTTTKKMMMDIIDSTLEPLSPMGCLRYFLKVSSKFLQAICEMPDYFNGQLSGLLNNFIADDNTNHSNPDITILFRWDRSSRAYPDDDDDDDERRYYLASNVESISNASKVILSSPLK